MEGLEGGGDLQTGVAAQGRIDLLKDEGGIGWQLRGRCGQGAANFRRWEIAALRAEGKHACARGPGSACHQNGGWTKTADGEVDGGVAGAGEVVGDEQARCPPASAAIRRNRLPSSLWPAWLRACCSPFFFPPCCILSPRARAIPCRFDAMRIV